MGRFKQGQTVHCVGPGDKRPRAAVAVGETPHGNIEIRLADGRLVLVDPGQVWETSEKAWSVCRDIAARDLKDAQKRLAESEAALSSIDLVKSIVSQRRRR